jgi:uncharacterized protein (DUF2141 family)
MKPSHHLAAATLAGACVLAAATPSSGGGPPSAPLSVKLSDLRSTGGKVGCTLYAGPKGFPTDPSAALQRRWCKIERSTSICRFGLVPQGTYAVACFHDEDDDGELDTGWFGIPTEGTVVSNHAKGRFGPPRWDDAKFAFSGRPAELSLRMSY